METFYEAIIDTITTTVPLRSTDNDNDSPVKYPPYILNYTHLQSPKMGAIL